MLIKAGTIVFHIRNGFGIVLDSSDSYAYKVHFLRNHLNETEILNGFLDQVDEELLRYVKGETYFFTSDFSSRDARRGEDYYDWGKVRSLSYDEKRRAVLATVSGSNRNLYNIEIIVKSDNLYDRCSCPVGFRCKHTFATLMEFYDVIQNLEQYYQKYIEENTYKKIKNADLNNEEYKKILQNFLDREYVEYSDQAKNFIIANHENLIKTDEVKFFRILEGQILYGGSLKRNKMQEILAKLPNGEYIASYVNNKLSCYHYYDWSFPNSKKKFKILNEEGLKYFTPEYKIYASPQDEVFILQAYLTDPLGMQAVSYEKSDGKTERSTGNYIDGSRAGIFFDYLKNEIEKKYGNEIELAKKEFDEKVEKIKYERKCRAFLNDIEDLSSRLTEGARSYRKNEKLILEPAFIIGEKCYVSFKVGFEKKYVIKNIRDFVIRMRENATYQYGKNLKFCHNAANFDEISKKFLEYLLMQNESTLYPIKRELPISEVMCRNMLLDSKGRIVEINGENYRLILDGKDAKIYIDKDYSIKLMIRDESDSYTKEEKCDRFFYPENENLFLLEDTLFLLDKKRKTVSLINADRIQSHLFMFAALNHGIDTRISGDKFKEKIFAKAHKDIAVADEISEELHAGELKIEAYFDFEGGILSVKEKLFVDDNQVKKEKLPSDSDKYMYEQFDDILSSFGFNNGIMTEDNEIMNFLRSDLSSLNGICNVFLSESLKRKQIISFNNAVIRVKYDNDLMQAFMAPCEYSEEELSKIYYALKKKKKYVQLSGDRIIDLDNDEARDFASAVKDLALNPDRLYEEKQIGLVESLKALSHERSCQVDEYLNSMVEDIRHFKENDIAIPKLNATLRPYQRDGFRWLSILTHYGLGGVLADDMGLGKTLEVIALIASDETKKPSIVICPTSVIYNWQNEFMKFAPDESVVRIYGNINDRHKAISEIKKNKKVVYVTSYDSMRNDIEMYKKIAFNYAVLDEAQNIKNLNALRSKNVKSIKADHKFALTGTPIENNLMDLWSIFDFAIPGFFENAKEFQNLCTTEGFAEQVAKRIAPFLLRRTKEKVLSDLPDKYERIVTAEMTEKQRQVYDACVNEARKALEDGGALFDVLPFITRLRQVCVSPELFVEDYEGGSGKLEMLSRIITEYIDAGHRILIFSQFVTGLEAVKKILDNKKINYFVLTGGTPAKERTNLMEEFNSNSENKVFLISLKAGGTGLNLTGADTVIHLDPWWNTAAENQASDRAHRIGQLRNVEVIKLICENSIEERVIELQNLKKDIIDKVIAKDDSAVQGAKLEDIAFILK